MDDEWVAITYCRCGGEGRCAGDVYPRCPEESNVGRREYSEQPGVKGRGGVIHYVRKADPGISGLTLYMFNNRGQAPKVCLQSCPTGD